MLANNTPRAAGCRCGQPYRPLHLAARPSRTASLRTALCAAGMATLLSATLGVAAYADVIDVPDHDWTPDAPSIDGGTGSGSGSEQVPDADPTPPETGGGDTGGSGDVSGGNTGGSGDAGSGDAGATDPGTDNTGDVVVTPPDSTPSTPSYEETYGGGSTGSVAASEDAFYDESAQQAAPADAAPAEEQPAEEAQAGPAAGTPTFVSYDASTRTLVGTANPGTVVRLVDGAQNVLAETWTGEDGTFYLVLPEGIDLAATSIVSFDGAGAQVGDALAGTSVAEAVDAQERATIGGEVSGSADALALAMASALESSGIGAGYEQDDEGGMPVVPYVLGAAAALVAVGGVGAGAYAVYRGSRRRHDEQLAPGEYAPVFAASMDAAGASDSFAPVGRPSDEEDDEAYAPDLPESTPGRHASNGMPAEVAQARPADEVFYDDGLDELERIALGIHGGYSAPSPAVERDATDSTMAFVAAGSAAASLLDRDPDDPDDGPEPPDGPGGFDPSDTLGALPRVSAPSAPLTAGQSAPERPASTDAAVNAPAMLGCDDESTLAFSTPYAPQDPLEFAETARIIARGEGRVHRVSASKRDLDFSGLDAYGESQTVSGSAPSANPLAADDDWRSLAFDELAARAPREASADLSTDDYVALLATKRSKPVGAPVPSSTYVAPVIGPAATLREEAARHRAQLANSQAPAAIALRSRDEAFRAQSTQAGFAARVREAGAPAVSAEAGAVAASPCMAVQNQGAPSSQPARTDGVPRIERGAATPGPAARQQPLYERGTLAQGLRVPDVEPAFAVSAPRAQGVSPSDIAAAAAGAAYAAFASEPAPMSVPAVVSAAPYVSIPEVDAGGAPVLPAQQTTQPVAEEVSRGAYEPLPASGSAYAARLAAAVYGSAAERAACAQNISTSVAAAYASAVYADVRPYEPVHMRAAGGIADASVSTPGIPAVVEEASTTSTLSPEYINYLVQDEFEHRHDSIAQRNAARSHLHIVNGAASAPVPLEFSVHRYRHRA